MLRFFAERFDTSSWMSPFAAVICGALLATRWVVGAPLKDLSEYTMVFAEEFDDANIKFVNDRNANKVYKWFEGIWFSHEHVNADHFTTVNSELTLQWTRGQSPPDTSISTFSRSASSYSAWRYGYFEARMKWKPENGAWPAFWMIPIPKEGDRPAETGEIDIFEGQGDEPRSFFGTIHRWIGRREMENSAAHNRFAVPRGTDFSSFHAYGLLWVPGRVTWYFDGLALHSEPTYTIFDRQNYMLILGMQEGADWKSGNLTGVTAKSMTLTVDWVRVWQKQRSEGP